MLAACCRLRLSLLSRLSVGYSSAAAATVQKVDKEALKQLRKRTGYSYVNCRKALLEYGPDRLEEAVNWLKQKALNEGWEKAAKLGDRPTRQGLVGVLVQGKKAAIVEVNSETDFVARNVEFKKLVEEVAKSTLEGAEDGDKQKDGLTVMKRDIDTLKSASSNRPIRDLLVEKINKLGENIQLARADVITAGRGIELQCYAHPKESCGCVHMGRYVSVIGLRRNSTDSTFPTSTLGEQLCQHIVGMRTELLGTPPPPQSKDAVQTVEESSNELESEEDELNAFEKCKVTRIDEDETQLLRQAFMLNPSETVHDYVSRHGATIFGFYRVELGQDRAEVKQ